MEFLLLKIFKLEMGMINVFLYLNYIKIKVFNFVEYRKYFIGKSILKFKMILNV